MNPDTYSSSAVPLSKPPDSAYLSPDERARAEGYLRSTGEKFLETLMNVSQDQWNFKPAPERWSIGQIAEHVVIVEKRVQANVDKMGDAPAVEPGRDNAQVDEAIIQSVFTRTKRVEAPPFLHPSEQCCPRQILAQFLETRAKSLELLNSAPWLRGRVISHPLSGPWDGYQWLLAGAGHSARHTEQIWEVKSSPNFPQS